MADERARLARDLHDIVSHNLSVVVVQAAGARAQGHVGDTTLAKIERSGRESLVEMRRMLGVLRTDDSATCSPNPASATSSALAETVRGAGVEVEVDVTGETVPAAPVVELTAYRVVQEALANVVRHAGPGSHASVAITVADDRVLVRVADDGRGAGAVPDVGGQGIVGMRERVTLMGGELRIGPRRDGGFEVYADLPHGADP